VNKFIIVRKDSYHDSVLLMRISREIKDVPGVEDAVIAMGTPQNISLLRNAGYSDSLLDTVGPNDLVIAIQAEHIQQAQIEKILDDLLEVRGSGEEIRHRPTTISAVIREVPEANLLLISVPGEYATREARIALSKGLHVMIFSDNVSLEDELSLKKTAVRKGLLCMGPDCGTAIINGKPLAFANVVRPGSIGIVGASGTGIQEVTCCIHRLGGGITQAIGTGGRDLSDEIGGMMTIMGIRALAEDPETEVIVVISKPPSRRVADTVTRILKTTGKKCVVHFVGEPLRNEMIEDNLTFTSSLAVAAEEACRFAGIAIPTNLGLEHDVSLVEELSELLSAGTKVLGLFCGGTTGYEALSLLTRHGFEVMSNLYKNGPLGIQGTQHESGHSILDLGSDEFTAGRPHPMIDPVLRNERLELEMHDSRAGLLLFDLILGYGSHDDPASILAEGVQRARESASMKDRKIVAVASITGTPIDPQGYDRQRRYLEDAGIVVMPDNFRAASLIAAILRRVI